MHKYEPLNRVKALIRFLIWRVNALFYGEDAEKNFSTYNPILILKTGIIQKVIGINRHVPWPVHPTTEVLAPQKIQNSGCTPGWSMGCFLDGRNGIIIEDNVWIGPRVSLISQDHENSNYHIYRKEEPIIIKKNCLLCANSVILPGVILGEHTIVAAGAIVTKSFPYGNQVLAGNPAQIVKELESYSAKDVLKCAE